MTINVTLGEKTLNVTRLTVEFEVKGSQWDKWENQQYKRKVYVYGILRRWKLRCVEENVAWNDSAAKYAEDNAQAGAILNFKFSDDSPTPRYNIDTNVYVLGCTVELETSGSTNIRYFTIQLQEA